jgi:hypothetical protein
LILNARDGDVPQAREFPLVCARNPADADDANPVL